MENSQEIKDAQTVYELGYLVLPSIAEDDLAKVSGNIKNAIKKAGGTDFDGEEPVKIDLAYTMSKTVGASRYVVNDAYIGWVKFEAEPGSVSGIKSDVEKMGEVLRFLIIKAPRKTTFTFAEAFKSHEGEASEGEAAEGASEPSGSPEEPVVE